MAPLNSKTTYMMVDDDALEEKLNMDNAKPMLYHHAIAPDHNTISFHKILLHFMTIYTTQNNK